MIEVIAERLRDIAFNAFDRAATAAADAVSAIANTAEHAQNESAVANARQDIAEALARSAILSDSMNQLDRHLSEAWLTAVEQLLPAAVAAERATAAAAARGAAVNQRAAARRRHPDIDDLLR